MKSHARMTPTHGQQSQFSRSCGELGPCAEIKLFQYVLEVVRGGFLADHQHPCDLAIGETSRDELRDLTLAWGKWGGPSVRTNWCARPAGALLERDCSSLFWR
jgi:hypothetical protein